MSNFALTKASTAALTLLCRTAGTDQLLLIQPARELRAEITVEPIGTADQRGQIEAVLHLREQRHSITLQRDDGANAQHLAEWVEAAANGTADTALAIPQRAVSAPLLPCRDCGSEAIGYDYASQGSTFRHGVKCRHRDCQSVEGAETATEAHTAWNEMQAEPVDEPDLAQDEQYPPCDFCGVIPDHHPWHGSGMFKGVDSPHIHACNDCRYLLPSRTAQTEQQATVKECLTVQPMAYAVFAANGNVVCFSTRREHPSLVALENEGQSIVPLAPIAETAPQPEQSDLVEALEAIVQQYPNPDISHVEYRVHACKQAEVALANYRAAQAARPAA